MKIGILTFHCAHNYGAILQCYGLQEYLKRSGHDVYVIDYRPDYIVKGRDYLKNSYRLYITKSLGLLPKVFLDAVRFRKLRCSLWNKFETFISTKLNLCPVPKQFVGEEFDLCIVGSDQIWNKMLTGGFFDPMYFGANFKCPVISYAASTINESLNEDDKVELKHLLRKLSGISVRERKLKKQLDEIGFKNVEVVCDPTLLTGAETFKMLADSVPRPKVSKYIAIYRIRQDPNLIDYAYRLSKKTRLPIIEITTIFNSERWSQKVYDSSVENFLAIIKGASYVVTNSFHGTAFSLLFNKNFVAIRQNGPVDDRIEQLLTSVGLIDRFVQPNIQVIETPIDFNSHDEQFRIMVEKSRNFLNRFIDERNRTTINSTNAPVFNK